MKRAILYLLTALLSLVCIAEQAGATVDEPRATVQRLNDALLDAMKNAAQLGFQGRYDQLTPVLEQTFAFSEMPGLPSVGIGANSALRNAQSSWRT